MIKEEKDTCKNVEKERRILDLHYNTAECFLGEDFTTDRTPVRIAAELVKIQNKWEEKGYIKIRIINKDGGFFITGKKLENWDQHWERQYGEREIISKFRKMSRINKDVLIEQLGIRPYYAGSDEDFMKRLEEASNDIK